jgi:hypothetical protein
MQTDSLILDNVPSALGETKLRHLPALRRESRSPTVIGRTPVNFRRVGLVTGGYPEVL